MVTKRRRPPRTNDPREIEAWRRDQDDDNFVKANKVINGNLNHIAVLQVDGDIKDGGSSITDLISQAFFYGRNY